MYSDYNGNNFAECVNEVSDVMGVDAVFDKITSILNDGWDDDTEISLGDLKKEILNSLWCM